MKIKNILTIGLVCCGVAAALTSCSKDEDPYFSISDSDAPRILNTDFSRENPDDENSPILFKINRDEHFTFELKVTPVDKSTISWLIEGKEMSNDKKIDIMLEAGTYKFKVVVRANNGKETYRQGTILVSPLSNDPNTDSNQKLEFIQAPGTTVKMSGINMSNIKQVRINDRLIDVIKATEGSIEYTLPADMPEGEYRLSLIDESGTSYGAGMVTVTNDVIVSQADFLGQSAGNVKISGMNLTNVASVTVDGKACSIVSQEDAKMVVQLPELTEGTFELKATTKSGAAVKFLKDGEFVETASIKVSLIAETILWEGSHAVDWGTIWENAEVTTELKKYAKVGATLRLYVKRTASDYCKGCATVNWTNICTGKGEVVPGDGLRGDIDITDDMNTIEFVLTETSMNLLNQGNLQVVGHGFDLLKITIQ